MQKISHQPTKIKQKQKKTKKLTPNTNLKNPNQQYKTNQPSEQKLENQKLNKQNKKP